MSFRNTLSQMWNNIQYTLFPMLEERLGELSSIHKKLISVLELVRIEEFIKCSRFLQGRPPKDRACIAKAYIAKIIFKFPHTKQLIQQLKIDNQLKEICGWNLNEKIPSESKFSRAFKEFARTNIAEKAHQVLIKGVYKDRIAGNVVKDSTPIATREKAFKKKGSPKDRRREKDRKRRREKSGLELSRRQRQLKESNLNNMIKELPIYCDKGMKTSGQGHTAIWKGYKLHSAIDDHCIPLAVILTSASLHDCEVAIPLAEKAQQVALNFYDLMDAAYDHPEIKEHSISLGHVPIIDKCPKNKQEKIEKELEKGRKHLLKFATAEDKRYAERLPKERYHALYKDYYGGGNSIFYRGHTKVFCHVMFGVLALTATTLINLIKQ